MIGGLPGPLVIDWSQGRPVRRRALFPSPGPPSAFAKVGLDYLAGGFPIGPSALFSRPVRA